MKTVHRAGDFIRFAASPRLRVPASFLRFCCGLVAGCLLALAARAEDKAAPASTPLVSLPFMKLAPKIDGLIEEAEWADAVRNVGFVSHETGIVTHRRAVFWVGCDRKQLFIAIKAEVAPDGKILTRAVPDGKRDILAAFYDDAIELALDPKRGRTQGDRSFYHLIANARGALYDACVNPDNPQNPMDFNWRLPAWEFSNQVRDGYWNIEAAFPVASLGATEEDLKGPWGVRVALDWKRPFEQSQWESAIGAYLDRPSMPVIRWDPAAPVVQMLSLEREGKAEIAISVRNPHETELAVQAHIEDAWHRNPPVELKQALTVPAGQTKTVQLAAPDGGPEGPHRTVIRVTSPDGAKVYYFRDFRWSLHRPQEVWSLETEQKKAVELRFKYYPYHNKIRLHVGIGALEVKERVTGASAEIREIDRFGAVSKRVLWQKDLTFTKDVSEDVYEIPDLNNGTYLLAVTLKGDKDAQGLPKAPVTQTFVRRHFEWERNTLGMSDEVMPPFTPLEATGATVKSVLREHEHGDSGVWKQVTSQGRALLTAPMSWEVQMTWPDAKPILQAVKGEGWKCLSQKPTGVVGEAKWSAGPLRANVRTEYDYDGMMLTTLTLEPTGGAVHRLSLVIPLADSETRYMHAVTDGLRHNYAGFTPKGEGRVWDSSKANRIDLIGAFLPYLWVGGAERGLCWFADTDKDWSLDDDAPMLDLTREGKTLLMRVHFITKPTVLKDKRQIVFGIQATPTKPMPEGWRRWVGRKQIPGGRAVSWMGATYYWGALAYDVYPLDKRFEIYRQFTECRSTGKANPAHIDQWMKYLEPFYGDDKGQRDFWLAHIRAGFHVASSETWATGVRQFGYTNARGIGFRTEEFATFQDEWARYAWFHRDWSSAGAIAYDVSPSPSFVDFAVWYYKRMLDCFDGVYWDNVFLSPHYDELLGSAWLDEKGRAHPGLGLMHLRDLVKRTAIMHWQEGRKLQLIHGEKAVAHRLPFIQLSHTTNTMIVPVLSFGNCNMDWEWKYGLEDFQDRFSADLTVAETIGRQVGAWGTILGGGHPDPKDPRTAWMYRTRLGICLVHEIHNYDYTPQLDWDVYKKLFEFGYGEPDCRVFNYWDESHPVTVESQTVDARTLALARGGAAIVIVTDYGKGGECLVKLDAKALGLKPEATAVDMETNQPVKKVGPGQFRLALKKHDFKILRLAAP